MEELDKGFDSFWSLYPRRVGKLAAIRAYRKALKMATPEEIQRGAKLYAQEGKAMEYTAHPATWLNAGRWGDYPAPIEQKFESPFFYAPFGSPEQDAWDRHARSQGKLAYPRDKRGGWYFPTRWPA